VVQAVQWCRRFGGPFFGMTCVGTMRLRTALAEIIHFHCVIVIRCHFSHPRGLREPTVSCAEGLLLSREGEKVILSRNTSELFHALQLLIVKLSFRIIIRYTSA
jgi:hypothetical protein